MLANIADSYSRDHRHLSHLDLKRRSSQSRLCAVINGMQHAYNTVRALLKANSEKAGEGQKCLN